MAIFQHKARPAPEGLSRRTVIGAALAAAVTTYSPKPARAAAEVLTPEMFGAKGDGRTNDTLAFDMLSQQINSRGGGTIVLRKAVYLVGYQVPSLSGTGYSFAPKPILHFLRCNGPVAIEGNGATLRCAPGLRFGTFNVATGEPVQHPMPYIGPDKATPYEYMIRAEECAGSITIVDLELDGNLPRLRLGGPHGDIGYQIAGTGIYLRENRGDEILRNIHTHHHPQDGLMIDGVDDLALAKRVVRHIEGVRSEYNARQGCSIIGGSGYAFSRCAFNHTGRAGLYSPPGAGVDIEAEGGKRNRNVSFAGCEFIDNSGAGMVADSGPSEGALFTRCKFVGTTSWSAWPNKPAFTFRDCTFIGAMCHAAEVTDKRLATTFIGCTFLDDPAKSPTGKVYLPSGDHGAICDLNEVGNPLFIGCRFTLTHNAQLPWSIRATYRDCTMSQASPRQAYPRGTFEGVTTIKGNVDLYGSKIPGAIVVNGRRWANMNF